MRFSLILLLLGAIALNAQNATLLVLNKDEASLAIVDPASKKVLGRVPVGESPHEVATDGTLAFVSNYGSHTPGQTLSVIDIAAQKEIHRVDLGSLRKPHGIFCAGGKVYFTAENNKLIGRYDPASNQVDWLLGTGQNSTHMVLLNRDQSRIFTANIASNSISIFEPMPGPAAWTQTVVPVGKGPEGLDLSPDGKQLWTAHSGDGGVSVIDVASKRVVATIDLKTKRSNRLKFTPDGTRVLVTDMGGGELVVLDAASHKELKRIPVGKSPEGILMRPDGSVAYIAVTGENKISIFDLNLLDVTESFAPGTGPDGMAWAVRQ